MSRQSLSAVIDLIVLHQQGEISEEQFKQAFEVIDVRDKVTVGETADAFMNMLQGMAKTFDSFVEVQEERYRVLVESLPKEYQETIKTKLKENQDDILDILDEGEDE